MNHEFYISERADNFKSHSSLNESPFSFETDFLKGAIFFLPSKGKFGGDTFIIYTKDCIAVSLVGDMAGHGCEGRKRLNPYLSNLDKITSEASANSFNHKAFFDELIKLDQEVDEKSLISFSLVRFLPNGEVYYLNNGENQIVFCEEGKIYNPSSKINRGKLGVWHYCPTPIEEFAKTLKIYQIKLKSKDKIFIYTDGFADYLQDFSFAQKRKKLIEKTLSFSSELENIIIKLNNSAQKDLGRIGILHPLDDYTVIGLELK
ncbi:MAG: SpoIIE family protein phosphatase [Candidatus Nanoarchaeia archaeon]|nr:SpoIIE family protein phosphatase [Candidatus Nanoarchaeia archaeon]